MIDLSTKGFQRLNDEWVISGNISVEVEDISHLGATYKKTMIVSSKMIRVATHSLRISKTKPNWLNLISEKESRLVRVSEHTIVRFFDHDNVVAELRLKDLPEFVRGDNWVRPLL